jgi:HEAT repeat protein
MSSIAVSLARSLALASLASLAFAQNPSKPAPASKTGSTQASPAAPSQESPRALLERAAFLEEHERDFEAAAKLYEQAASAAQLAGDGKTAAEAQLARERVLARLGKAPEVIDRKSIPPSDDAITNRILQLFYEQSSHPGPNTLSDLQQFGSRVVPLAEEALSGRVNLGSLGSVMISSDSAAVLLSNIDTPAATAALDRALRSPDPVVRRTVAEHLYHPDRHRALLEFAAQDPVDAVREAAIRILARWEDPDLMKIMEPAATAGSRNALGWMGLHAAKRLMDFVLSSDSNASLQLMAIDALRSASGVPMDPRFVEAMLALARSKDPDTRRQMPSKIARFFEVSWKDAPESFRHQIENVVLQSFSQFAYPEVMALLRDVGGIESIELVAKMNPDELEIANVGGIGGNSIVTWIQAVASRLTPSDYERLAACLRQLHEPAEPKKANDAYFHLVNALSEAMHSVARQRPSAQAIAAGYSGLEGSKQRTYLAVVRTWIDACCDKTTMTFPPDVFAPVILPVVLDALNDSDSAPGGSFLAYLVASNDVRFVPPLLAWDRRYTNPDYRTGITRAVDDLVSKNHEAARTAVAEAIAADWERPDRHNANASSDFALLPPEDALQVFETLWPRATTKAIRGELLSALDAVSGPEVTNALFKHYSEVEGVVTRGNVMRRFGKELYEPAIPLLGEELRSKNDSVRGAAQSAFKAFKEQRDALDEFSAWMNADKDARASVAELTKLLDSNNRDVVIGAVRALGAVKARSALPALVKLLERQDPELKKAVEETIARIGG